MHHACTLDSVKFSSKPNPLECTSRTVACACRIYWMNPLQYAQKAILINEFSGGESCDMPVS